MLLVVAAGLFFNSRDSDDPAVNSDPASRNTKGQAGARDQTLSARRERQESGPTGESETTSAKDLELLWARSDEDEIVDALEKVGEANDPEQWRLVATVFIQKAATESRPELVQYLLATGDAAPTDIRLAIYAAAFDNKTPGVSASAKLELQNLTGQVFRSGEEARTWISNNPDAAESE